MTINATSLRDPGHVAGGALAPVVGDYADISGVETTGYSERQVVRLSARVLGVETASCGRLRLRVDARGERGWYLATVVADDVYVTQRS